MNWIWEDEISSITIDRDLPCLESYFKVEADSIDQLSDYMQELKKSLRRFGEIYPGLKVLIMYEYDSGISLLTVNPVLKDLVNILDRLSYTRIAVMNSGKYSAILPLELMVRQSSSSALVRHFDEKEKAKAWLKSAGTSVL